MEEIIKYHWYLMVYESVHGGIPKQTVYEPFDDKDSIAFDDIERIKKKHNLHARSNLTNVAYLGHMTEDYFYGVPAIVYEEPDTWEKTS